MTARYNEAFDDATELRPAYRAFHSRTGMHPLHPDEDKIARLARSPLGDAYTIAAVALVLDDHEYQYAICAGVRQRALALQALFYDMVRGETAVLHAVGIPDDLFDRLVQQHGADFRDLAEWWNGKPREAVRFTYGPDLVRAPDGCWCVLEDNVGCIGGVVDSQLVLDAYLTQTGASLHDAIPTGSDLPRAVQCFVARVGHKPSSRRVAALTGLECDPEAVRRHRVLQRLGIRVLNPVELEHARRDDLCWHDIEAIINFDETSWRPTSTFAESVFRLRNVSFMTAPGVGVLGNKLLLPFIDDIVAFYSRSAPILRTVPTTVYHALPPDPRGWVLKESNSRQGRGVFFLEGMTDAARAQLVQRLSARGPASAVLQTRVSASFVPVGSGHSAQLNQIELRPLVFVVGDGVCVVGENASGRTFRVTNGFGTGNMSQGAQYLPVIREPTVHR